MQWQTIDTAPKDGRPFLAVLKNGHMHVMIWWSNMYVTQFGYHQRQPTHWQPLPELPCK